MKILILIALIISFSYSNKFIDQMKQEQRDRKYKKEQEKRKLKTDRILKRMRNNTFASGVVFTQKKSKVFIKYYNQCLEINHKKRERLTNNRNIVLLDSSCKQFAKSKEAMEKYNQNNSPRERKKFKLEMSDR